MQPVPLDLPREPTTLRLAATRGEVSTAAMLIGDSVIYDGRAHVIVGFTPVSVEPAEVELHDPKSGMAIWVEMSLVRSLDSPFERAAFRIVPPGHATHGKGYREGHRSS